MPRLTTKPITARAATDATGHTYYDDQQHADRNGEVVRLVYAKPGDLPQ